MSKAYWVFSYHYEFPDFNCFVFILRTKIFFKVVLWCALL